MESTERGETLLELSQDVWAARALEAGSTRGSRPAAAHRLLTVAPAVVLVPVSVGLWLAAVRQVDINRVTDLGLISVLPPLLFVATALLTASFALGLRRRASNTPLILLHLVVLIVMLYGITPIVEHGVTRFAATYKHVGIVDYILRTGRVNPRIDAYFNWPAFFIFSAFAQRVAGLRNVQPVIQWAPVVFNLMYLAPLAAICRSATGDRRLVWLGVWFFYMMNWVGQDYFSPQGMAYFFYLSTLAIVLTWFRAALPWTRVTHGMARLTPKRLRRRLAGWVAPPDAPSAHTTLLQRFGLVLILVAVLLATVASHQLTPFAILAVLTAFVLFNRTTLRGLPVLIFAAALTWIVFMANDYLAGHIGQITGNTFRLGSTINQNVGSRLGGSPQHLLVVRAALLTTAGIFGLAVLGALRSIRHGYRDLTYALLVAAPFGLLVLQSYEGEGLLRVYLYSLPGVAFFAAALFFTTPMVGRSWRTAIAVVVVSQALIGAFYLTRYGNERMDYFSPAELAAVNRLYAIAPRGSVLMAGTDNVPWRFRGYEQYTYAPANDPLQPTQEPLVRGQIRVAVHQIGAILSDPQYTGGFIIFTRSERAYARMFGVYPPGTYDRLERAIARSPAFTRLYGNRDAAIYALAGMRPGRVRGTGRGR